MTIAKWRKVELKERSAARRSLGPGGFLSLYSHYSHSANAFLLFYQMPAAHATAKAKIFTGGAEGVGFWQAGLRPARHMPAGRCFLRVNMV